MKRLILFTSVFILILNSCEKEQGFEDFQSSTLIRQVSGTEDQMQILTYYTTRNIFEEVTRFSYRKFLYNNKNQLIKIDKAFTFNPLSCAIIPGTSFEDGDDPRNAKITQFDAFEYSDNGNLKTKKSYYMNDDNELLMNYSTYEYENGKVTKINLYNPQDQLTHYYTYQYDDSGNVTTEEYYYMQDFTDAQLQTRIVYEYDTKNNPFRVFAVEGTPGRNNSKNNITRQTTINYYGGDEQSYIVEYVYEYNALGYPVKANNLDYIYGEDN